MRERDKDDIRHQIDIILRAYIDQDWQLLQQTQQPDWLGFFPRLPQITKGRNELIATAENSSEGQLFVDYEMIEIDYCFYGDVCVAPSVARARGSAADGSSFCWRIC